MPLMESQFTSHREVAVLLENASKTDCLYLRARSFFPLDTTGFIRAQEIFEHRAITQTLNIRHWINSSGLSLASTIQFKFDVYDANKVINVTKIDSVRMCRYSYESIATTIPFYSLEKAIEIYDALHAARLVQ